MARNPHSSIAVVGRSQTRRQANVPLSYINDNCLVAFAWNGKPLAKEHGGPVRAFVPTLYGWKSVKWLDAIEVMNVDRPGFYEARGHNMRGDFWKEERYVHGGQ